MTLRIVEQPDGAWLVWHVEWPRGGCACQVWRLVARYVRVDAVRVTRFGRNGAGWAGEGEVFPDFDAAVEAERGRA